MSVGLILLVFGVLRTSVNRWPTFIGGILVGVLLTIGGMYIYASGIKMNLGAGIKNLINNRGGNTEKVVSKDIKAAIDPKPVFDFYTVLPEYETVVDEKQFIHDVKKPARPQEKDSTYILQAASYSSFKDADKLKAKLALNGLTSRIEKELIIRALEQTGSNVTRTARLLKISRKSLQTKMKELGLRDE